MKNLKIRTYLLMVLLLAFHWSCKETVTEPLSESVVLPTVKSTSTLSDHQKTEISNFIFGSDLSDQLEFGSGISAIYEGHATSELVYIPYKMSSSTFEVFTFNKGELLHHHMTIENHENSMSIRNSAGQVELQLSNERIERAEVTFNATYQNSRVACSAEDLAGGFLDCTDAVIDQARDAFGEVGGLAFDIACGLWVVCRGAFVLTCGTLAVANCDN